MINTGLSEKCPLEQTILINYNGTVYCEVEYQEGSYYWYQGSTSGTKPILVLKDGEKNGTNYLDEHYDITSQGYMKIINAQMKHQGIYTFVVTAPNRTTVRKNISVEITDLKGENRNYSLVIAFYI